MNKEKSISKFLDDLSSNSSTPGGGSAAALSGALTASVISFIANLTIGKDKYKNVETEVKKILNETEKLKKEMLLMIDQDSEILKSILASYKNNNQKQSEKICQKAVNFSMKMAKKSVELMQLNLEISKIGNKMLASDFEVAAYLGEAAVGSSIANLKINLKPLTDKSYKKEIKNEYQQLQNKSSKLKQEILKIANN